MCVWINLLMHNTSNNTYDTTLMHNTNSSYIFGDRQMQFLKYHMLKSINKLY